MRTEAERESRRIGRGSIKMQSSESRFLQELILYAASAVLSSLVIFIGLRQLDPDRADGKKALEHKKEIAKRLGRPLIHTNQYEDVIACDVINPDNIDVEFECIGGLEHVKQALFELVILPLRRPQLFSQGKLLSPQKGVLLYGPPGTGKTMLAKALAKESGAVFINVRISNLMSKWFGDAQKLDSLNLNPEWLLILHYMGIQHLLRFTFTYFSKSLFACIYTGFTAVSAVFTLAYKLQPAIIFIDEVDSFLGQRQQTDFEALTSMKTEFMSLWDGFTTDRNARVMVLAATNRPSVLDEAIQRRFTQTFEIGMPDQNERVKILKVIVKGENVEENIDYEYIATLCHDFSGSDLLDLCKQAAYFPVRELLNDEKNGMASRVSIFH
ncbi:hypothetical protein ZIOFF_023327 [Zingiber officinale]|uniref:AAA+ ATPase domain-containing protein n=1 Tax=Zingiber officinale TaxID=94328 RepID=A0A8J5H6F3_ZINOF|nr:hypothetical protein ZIOFF_023327 [Zingiber officinale]